MGISEGKEGLFEGLGSDQDKLSMQKCRIVNTTVYHVIYAVILKLFRNKVV